MFLEGFELMLLTTLVVSALGVAFIVGFIFGSRRETWPEEACDVCAESKPFIKVCDDCMDRVVEPAGVKR